MFFRKKSPENTNSSEQAPDSNSSNTEYPAFDPEAAKRRIAEYKAAHPKAVDDIDKAYEMAKAEDPFRTEAANIRNFAKQAWERREKQLAIDYEADAMENDDIAEARGEFVGKKYDSERAKAMAQTETKTQANADTATPGQTDMPANGNS
jgi:hypothetical protein